MQNFLIKAFSILSGLCSIFGFVALFVCDKDLFLVAVVAYAIAITAFFIALYILIVRSLSFRNCGKYRKIATLQTFTCDDSKTAMFETVKLIQSKMPFLSEVEHKRKWHGTGSPIFKVNGVPVPYSSNRSPDDLDIVNIKLDKILAYNETMSYTTSHECQFSEYKPRFGCRIEEPTDFIQFRILLGYKTSKVNPAKLFRRSFKAGSVALDEFLCNIDFDKKHKLFFKIIDKPEIGYDYFVTWDK